ncbi:hypothetical protein V8F06_008048 [Rhypophila decipiens]
MVHIASFAVVAAVLAGQAVASTTCVKDQMYCGWSLLDGKDRATWEPRVNQALGNASQPQDGTHKWDSLFLCKTPTTLQFVDFCKKDLSNHIICQPANSGKCSGNNDCCAV